MCIFLGINCINDTYFAGCEKLLNIDISGNRISFTPNIDHIARSSISISLSMNQLSGVFEYFTTYFPKLKALHIERNHITSFCVKQTRHLPSLNVLTLGKNNITHFDIEFVSILQRQLLLNLGTNPIRCENMKQWQSSCELADDDTNRLSCGGDKLELHLPECVNNTGRFRVCRYFSYKGINTVVVVITVVVLLTININIVIITLSIITATLTMFIVIVVVIIS